MSYEDNYDQTARWDAESVREAEVRHTAPRHAQQRRAAETEKEGQAPPLCAVACIRTDRFGDFGRCGLAAGRRHVLVQQRPR